MRRKANLSLQVGNIRKCLPAQDFRLHDFASFSVFANLPLPSDTRQLRPPFDAGGLLHRRALRCCPSPQVVEQVLKSDHSPQLPFTKKKGSKNSFTFLCLYSSFCFS